MLRALPGFRHAYCAIDRATGAGAGVTVFAAQPAAAVLTPLWEEFRGSLGASTLAQPPELTGYESAAKA